MTLRTLHINARRNFRLSRIAQVGLLMMFWLLGNQLARALGLPLPGGVIGLLLALGLLLTRRMSPATMRRGAEWLLADMLLFFIPATLAVLEHPEFLGWLGLKILLAILGGTALVMIVTAVTVELCARPGEAP